MKEPVTVDQLLQKVPNKYELSIIAGKKARQVFLEGVAKNKIIPTVFDEIMEELEK